MDYSWHGLLLECRSRSSTALGKYHYCNHLCIPSTISSYFSLQVRLGGRKSPTWCAMTPTRARLTKVSCMTVSLSSRLHYHRQVRMVRTYPSLIMFFLWRHLVSAKLTYRWGSLSALSDRVAPRCSYPSPTSRTFWCLIFISGSSCLNRQRSMEPGTSISRISSSKSSCSTRIISTSMKHDGDIKPRIRVRFCLCGTRTCTEIGPEQFAPWRTSLENPWRRNKYRRSRNTPPLNRWKRTSPSALPHLLPGRCSSGKVKLGIGRTISARLSPIMWIRWSGRDWHHCV